MHGKPSRSSIEEDDPAITGVVRAPMDDGKEEPENLVEKSTVLTRLPKVLFCQIRWNLNVCKNRDFFLL